MFHTKTIRMFEDLEDIDYILSLIKKSIETGVNLMRIEMDMFELEIGYLS